jgi:putative hydrolase of the HAD superfamily
VIFFDLDGTLIDDDSVVRAAVATFHERYKTEIPDDLDAFQGRWREMLERWFDRYLTGELTMQGQRRGRMMELFAAIDEAEADRRFEVYRAAYAAATSTPFSLFPDVLPMLEAFKEQRLGIISNGQEFQQRAKLVATGIASRFEVVVVSSEAGVPKPDPAIFGEACRRTGESWADCWHVGDRLTHDALAAANAGLRGVWLCRDETHPADSRVPTIRSLAELPPLVASQG